MNSQTIQGDRKSHAGTKSRKRMTSSSTHQMTTRKRARTTALNQANNDAAAFHAIGCAVGLVCKMILFRLPLHDVAALPFLSKRSYELLTQQDVFKELMRCFFPYAHVPASNRDAFRVFAMLTQPARWTSHNSYVSARGCALRVDVEEIEINARWPLHEWRRYRVTPYTSSERDERNAGAATIDIDGNHGHEFADDNPCQHCIACREARRVRNLHNATYVDDTDIVAADTDERGNRREDGVDRRCDWRRMLSELARTGQLLGFAHGATHQVCTGNCDDSYVRVFEPLRIATELGGAVFSSANLDVATVLLVFCAGAPHDITEAVHVLQRRRLPPHRELRVAMVRMGYGREVAAHYAADFATLATFNLQCTFRTNTYDDVTRTLYMLNETEVHAFVLELDAAGDVCGVSRRVHTWTMPRREADTCFIGALLVATHVRSAEDERVTTYDLRHVDAKNRIVEHRYTPGPIAGRKSLSRRIKPCFGSIVARFTAVTRLHYPQFRSRPMPWEMPSRDACTVLK